VALLTPTSLHGTNEGAGSQTRRRQQLQVSASEDGSANSIDISHIHTDLKILFLYFVLHMLAKQKYRLCKVMYL